MAVLPHDIHIFKVLSSFLKKKIWGCHMCLINQFISHFEKLFKRVIKFVVLENLSEWAQNSKYKKKYHN